jgi:F-type H+-transporting ATPase subunit b
MEVVETIALISINATLVFQLLSFLLFLFIIHRIMIRPLDRVMQERNLFLDQLKEEIADAGDEYKQLCKQIKRQETEVRSTALKIKDDIEAAGQKTAAELIARTKEEIGVMKSKAQQDTAAKVKTALAAAQHEAAVVAENMIARLLEHNGELG